MDPLGVTASVIAVATLAWDSSKAAYELNDGLVDAPKAIVHTKNLLSETRNTLDSLKDALASGSELAGVLDSVLQKIRLDVALESARGVCNEFGETIKAFTSHSTDSRFSKRDRLTTTFRESRINRLNQQLGECQSTISLALESINLIVSSQTSEDVQRLHGRFTAQETALAGLERQLREEQASLQALPIEGSGDTAGGSLSAAERDSSAQLVAKLQVVCKEVLSATRAKRTGQSFGEMKAESSRAFQGIVGTAQNGVEQSFGALTATGRSTAAQGQMDANSFALMFGNRYSQ